MYKIMSLVGCEQEKKKCDFQLLFQIWTNSKIILNACWLNYLRFLFHIFWLENGNFSQFEVVKDHFKKGSINAN